MPIARRAATRFSASNRASSRRRALILDLSQNTGAACYGQVGGKRRKEQMATLDEIGQEKQRISERLARLDDERAKGNQLNEQPD